MEALLAYAQDHVQIAPYIIFGALILAGFNMPVSEDAMLFISAILASKHPDLFYQLFLAVFLGAYLSDLICYYVMGRVLGNRIFQYKFFAKMVSSEKIEKISAYYQKYGIMTLILGRFIPFGVRNALFFTAGLCKMNFVKFSLSDLLACTISTTFFFYIYYSYGNTVIEYVKKGNIVLFALVAIGVVIFLIKRRKRQSAA